MSLVKSILYMGNGNTVSPYEVYDDESSDKPKTFSTVAIPTTAPYIPVGFEESYTRYDPAYISEVQKANPNLSVDSPYFEVAYRNYVNSLPKKSNKRSYFQSEEDVKFGEQLKQFTDSQLEIKAEYERKKKEWEEQRRQKELDDLRKNHPIQYQIELYYDKHPDKKRSAEERRHKRINRFAIFYGLPQINYTSK